MHCWARALRHASLQTWPACSPFRQRTAREALFNVVSTTVMLHFKSDQMP